MINDGFIFLLIFGGIPKKMELRFNLKCYIFLHQGAHEHHSIGIHLILKMSRQSSKQTCAYETGGVMNNLKIISHNPNLLNYVCCILFPLFLIPNASFLALFECMWYVISSPFQGFCIESSTNIYHRSVL